MKEKLSVEKFLRKREGNNGDAFFIGNKVYGVFYRNKKVHIAEFVPYKTPPTRALCGHCERELWTSFVLTEIGRRGSERCEVCFDLIEELARIENLPG
jgi:hypothetical protein